MAIIISILLLVIMVTPAANLPSLVTQTNYKVISTCANVSASG